jgi:hypothetical protein
MSHSYLQSKVLPQSKVVDSQKGTTIASKRQYAMSAQPLEIAVAVAVAEIDRMIDRKQIVGVHLRIRIHIRVHVDIDVDNSS